MNVTSNNPLKVTVANLLRANVGLPRGKGKVTLLKLDPKTGRFHGSVLEMGGVTRSNGRRVRMGTIHRYDAEVVDADLAAQVIEADKALKARAVVRKARYAAFYAGVAQLNDARPLPAGVEQYKATFFGPVDRNRPYADRPILFKATVAFVDELDLPAYTAAREAFLKSLDFTDHDIEWTKP